MRLGLRLLCCSRGRPVLLSYLLVLRLTVRFLAPLVVCCLLRCCPFLQLGPAQTKCPAPSFGYFQQRQLALRLVRIRQKRDRHRPDSERIHPWLRGGLRRPVGRPSLFLIGREWHSVEMQKRCGRSNFGSRCGKMKDREEEKKGDGE
jgi:hypothetical protein